MKIKLAMLEKDQSYLNRIVTVFSTKYADKFEIYSFTDLEIAIKALEEARIDVFVASDAFEINVDAIPKRCGFAYFVDSVGIDSVNDQVAICKFQKADLIYKQVLNVFSETAGKLSGLSLDDDHTKVIVYASPSGGVGTSTMAAACAAHFAAQKKKVLFLSLEKFGSPDLFFSAEGAFTMSDIIYAIKSRKSNLALKLESCVKQDESGVYFFSQPEIALDMHELDTSDTLKLISEIKVLGTYDYIVIDMEFSINEENLKIYRQAHALIWVGDGSEMSNTKIQRAYASLSVLGQKVEAPLVNRLSLIYNKFSNKTGKTIALTGLKNIGGAPMFTRASTRQVLDQLAGMDMFDNLI